MAASSGCARADAALTPQGVAILHARSVTLRNGELTAKDVSIFRLDANDRLLERVEASRRDARAMVNGSSTMPAPSCPASCRRRRAR